jgi:hypothetical protein
MMMSNNRSNIQQQQQQQQQQGVAISWSAHDLPRRAQLGAVPRTLQQPLRT